MALPDCAQMACPGLSTTLDGAEGGEAARGVAAGGSTDLVAEEPHPPCPAVAGAGVGYAEVPPPPMDHAGDMEARQDGGLGLTALLDGCDGSEERKGEEDGIDWDGRRSPGVPPAAPPDTGRPNPSQAPDPPTWERLLLPGAASWGPWTKEDGKWW